MAKEQYVTYETAKLLKERGFDWDTYHYYDEIGRTWFEDVLCDWNHRTTPEVSCPTQQMAMRWLREERGIHIYPIPVTGFNYVVSVYTEKGNKTYDRILSRNGRNAYEDCIEAALEYVLKNLI